MNFFSVCRNCVFAVLFSFAIAFHPSNLFAQGSFGWINTNGGFYDVAGNWTPNGGPPAPADHAIFGITADYNVTWDAITGDRTNLSLTVLNGTARFGSVGGPFTYTIQTDTLVHNGGQLRLGYLSGPVERSMNLVTDRLLVENDGIVRVAYGSSLTTNQITISEAGGYGLVYVGGAGSELIQQSGGLTVVGFDGANAFLTVDDDAYARLEGTTQIARSVFNSSVGRLSVLDGATLDMNSVEIAAGVANGQSALFSVEDAGTTVNQMGNSFMRIGLANNSSGSLEISRFDSGATFNTGTGDIIVYDTGSISVGSTTSTGTFNVNGDLSLDGGSLEVNSGSVFNLATGKNLTADSGSTITLHGNRFFGKDNTIQLSEGATLTSSGYLDLGSSVGSGTINVFGSGSKATIAQHSIIGSSVGSGNVNVLLGGVVEYQNGLNISENGSVRVELSGNLNSGSSVYVDGGELYIDGSSSFNLAGGSGLVLTNDGDARFVGNRTIGNEQVYLVQSGSYLNVDGNLTVGSSLGDGRLSVSNASSLASIDGRGIFGQSGNTGELTVDNLANVNFGNGLNLAVSTVAGSQGIASVSNNSNLFVSGDVNVGTGGLSGQLGELNVSGPGSLFRVIGSGNVEIGADANSIGRVVISNGGEFNTENEIDLNPTGSLTLQGGKLQLADFNDNGGQFNFNAGELVMLGDHTIHPGIAFGNNLELNATKNLTIKGTATISPFYELTIDGGKFSVGDLSIADGGALTFNKGTLEFNNASNLFQVSNAGALGSSVVLNNQQNLVAVGESLIATEGYMSIGNGARYQAFSIANFGEIELGGNNARIKGTSTGSVPAMLNNGTIRGTGRIEGTFQNGPSGTLYVGDGGQITFDQDVINSAGGRITGRGTYLAPSINNYGEMLFSGGFTDLVAEITGQAGSQFIVTGGGTTTVFGDFEVLADAELRISDQSNAVFFDHVDLRQGSILSGSGNAYFEGGLSIGNSPSRQEFEFNVTLGASSDLLVEIAGTEPTLPEFDQYVFKKDLTLEGGSLTFDLIGLTDTDPDYAPMLGDSFQVLEVEGNWFGTFGDIYLPQLSSGLMWDLSGLYSNGTVSIVAAIPEPNTSSLAIIALATMFYRRRRARM